MNKRIVVIISTLMSVAAHAAPESGLPGAGQKTAVTKHLVADQPVQQVAIPVNTVSADAVDAGAVPAPAVPQTPVVDAPDITAVSSARNHTGLYLGIEGVGRGLDLGNKVNAGYRGAQQHHVRANGARLSMGYQFTDNVAIELGYMTGLTVRDANTIRPGVVSYTARRRVTGGDASVIYHFTDYIPGVYVRGGASYMQIDGTTVKTNRMRYRDRKGTRVHPDEVQSQRQSGLGLVAGIGYEAAVTDHIGVNVAYTRYQGIAGDNKSAMNMLSVGAKYRF